MSLLTRRVFVASTAAAAAEWLLRSHALPARAQGAPATIDVLLAEPIGTIAPQLYGHFAEHLGGVVYDGIWVGEQSRIPNLGGRRRAPGRPAWIGGSGTATRRRARQRCPTRARPQAIRSRSRFNTGASATSHGVAAATSRRRSTRRNFAASRHGCRATACR